MRKRSRKSARIVTAGTESTDASGGRRQRGGQLARRDGSDAADRLLMDDDDQHAPRLTTSEVANALRRRIEPRCKRTVGLPPNDRIRGKLADRLFLQEGSDSRLENAAILRLALPPRPISASRHRHSSSRSRLLLNLGGQWSCECLSPRSARTFVPMPEATLHENHLVAGEKRQIGLSGEVLPMKPVPHAVGHAPNDQFRSRIPALDGAHRPAARIFLHIISIFKLGSVSTFSTMRL